MPYLIVLAIAAGIGIAVYYVSLRDEGTIGSLIGTGPDEVTGAKGEGPQGAYVSVAPGRSDWQTRLTGLAGLLVAVLVGAALLAFTLYASVSSVVRLFDGVASGDPTP